MENKSVFKSRTIWFSVALAVLSVVQGSITQLPLGPVEQMCAGIAVAAAVAVLRLVTTQPLLSK